MFGINDEPAAGWNKERFSGIYIPGDGEPRRLA